MSASVDREQLRRDVSDALHAIQRDQAVTGLDALAASLTTLDEQPYAFHGRLMQKNLAAIPRNYSALIWSVVQVASKLEGRYSHTEEATRADGARTSEENAEC